ncbi:MAG TPA: response regulator [Candidatus Hydrogenedentes bacterium]|nr:response regulator [Candidatus Hydrogenedentota bacterium]
MADAKQILIVDDELDAVEFVTVVLEDVENVTTISANDGVSGLAKAKEAMPDLIILDVQMPGRGGFDVFADLKKDNATKGIPVIMLTGVGEKAGIHFSGKDMGQFIGAEPDAYIEKPVDPAELQKTVSGLLGL